MNNVKCPCCRIFIPKFSNTLLHNIKTPLLENCIFCLQHLRDTNNLNRILVSCPDCGILYHKTCVDDYINYNQTNNTFNINSVNTTQYNNNMEYFRFNINNDYHLFDSHDENMEPSIINSTSLIEYPIFFREIPTINQPSLHRENTVPNLVNPTGGLINQTINQPSLRRENTVPNLVNPTSNIRNFYRENMIPNMIYPDNNQNINRQNTSIFYYTPYGENILQPLLTPIINQHTQNINTVPSLINRISYRDTSRENTNIADIDTTNQITNTRLPIYTNNIYNIPNSPYIRNRLIRISFENQYNNIYRLP